VATQNVHYRRAGIFDRVTLVTLVTLIRISSHEAYMYGNNLEVASPASPTSPVPSVVAKPLGRLVPTFLCKIKAFAQSLPFGACPRRKSPLVEVLSELRFAIASSSFSEHQIS
jgi:hypothetical protein